MMYFPSEVFPPPPHPQRCSYHPLEFDKAIIAPPPPPEVFQPPPPELDKAITAQIERKEE